MNNAKSGPVWLVKAAALAKASAAPEPTSAGLQKLISSAIKYAPHPHEGFLWAAYPQNVYCDQLGVSDRTLRRWIKLPPFVCERVQIEGKVTTLIRLGTPGPNTIKKVQKHLANIWRLKVGKPIGGPGFGHLAGLVNAWGLDTAPAVLKMVLDDWSAFKAGVQIEVAKLGDEGKYVFHEWPSSSVILRFNAVGLEMYLMQQQAKLANAHKPLSSDQQASHPVVWLGS